MLFVFYHANIKTLLFPFVEIIIKYTKKKLPKKCVCVCGCADLLEQQAREGSLTCISSTS